MSPEGGTALLLFWVPVLAFFALVLAGSAWLARRRAARLVAWAAAAGWQLVGRDPSLAKRWTGQPFGQGSGRRVTEVLRGRFEGRPATSFTYRWTTGSGKNRTTHVRHVVALDLPAYLPTVELTPDGLAAKLAKAVGGQDISFESEAFNREWRVVSRDLAVAHAIVHPRLMERLLRPDALGQSLRIEGPSIVSWAVGATDTGALARRLGLLAAVAGAIPRHVWQDHGYDPMTDQTTRGNS